MIAWRRARNYDNSRYIKLRERTCVCGAVRTDTREGRPKTANQGEKESNGKRDSDEEAGARRRQRDGTFVSARAVVIIRVTCCFEFFQRQTVRLSNQLGRPTAALDTLAHDGAVHLQEVGDVDGGRRGARRLPLRLLLRSRVGLLLVLGGRLHCERLARYSRGRDLLLRAHCFLCALDPLLLAVVVFYEGVERVGRLCERVVCRIWELRKIHGSGRSIGCATVQECRVGGVYIMASRGEAFEGPAGGENSSIRDRKLVQTKRRSPPPRCWLSPASASVSADRTCTQPRPSQFVCAWCLARPHNSSGCTTAWSRPTVARRHSPNARHCATTPTPAWPRAPVPWRSPRPRASRTTSASTSSGRRASLACFTSWRSSANTTRARTSGRSRPSKPATCAPAPQTSCACTLTRGHARPTRSTTSSSPSRTMAPARPRRPRPRRHR